MTAQDHQQILWHPSAERVAAANLTAFSQRYCPDANYHQLHAWSIAEPDAFWRAVWEFCAVIGDMGALAYQPGSDLRSARFFPDARINYTANLLRGPAERTVIYGVGEEEGLQSWQLGALRDLVARLARGLRDVGVGPGDRVAGVVSNTPEAIAAMLATLAIGAIWTSCSPDFGPPAIADRFGQVEPKIIFAASGYAYGGKVFDIRPKLVQVASQIPSVRKYIVFSYAGVEASVANLAASVVWEDFIAGSDPGPVRYEMQSFQEPGFILFSSGTTGKPKCITHSAGGVLLKHLSELSLHCDITSGACLQYLTTCGWMMWNWQVSALALGATLVVTEGNPMYPQPAHQANWAWKLGVTHFGASAKYFSACAKAAVEPMQTHGRSGPRTIFSTGSPLLPATFDYLYRTWGSDLHVASISGGTDICACFVGGVPTQPVSRGLIQAAELGCDVVAFDAQGQPIRDVPGELVCRNAIPSMPVGFWGDTDGHRYQSAYFAKYPGVWNHGDWIIHSTEGSFVITGRSDATLNPSGVRIGTAEIYRLVESFPEVEEALAVGQVWEDSERIILFVRLAGTIELTADLTARIKDAIRTGASPRHVPALLFAVTDLPRTRSGKIAELAVRDIVHGRALANLDALANPESLAQFQHISSLKV